MPDPATLTPEQLHAWRERAGIAEYDGGLTREEAERVAWRQVGVASRVEPADNEQRSEPRLF